MVVYQTVLFFIVYQTNLNQIDYSLNMQLMMVFALQMSVVTRVYTRGCIKLLV